MPMNLAWRGGCWFEGFEVKVHLGVEVDFSPALMAHPAFVVENLDECRAVLDESSVVCNDDEPLLGANRTHAADRRKRIDTRLAPRHRTLACLSF